jgi:rod shape-determining protein MreD
MMWPRLFGLGSAWIIGLILDILQGSLLGQHAMALLVVGYLTIRFHLQIRIFPLWQLTATVFALLAIEAFILFWIDGIAGNPAVGYARWTQVLTGAVLWPLVMTLMDRIRERIEYRDRTFT